MEEMRKTDGGTGDDEAVWGVIEFDESAASSVQ